MVAGSLMNHGANRRHVVILHAAAQRVGHQLLRQCGDEGVGAAQKGLPQGHRSVHFGAVGKNAGSVHGSVRFASNAPCADSVEVFQREAERVHEVVADRAGRIPAMLFHTLSHRAWSHTCVVLFQRGYVRRRGRHGSSENVLQKPLAAQHGRRSRRVRRDGENAALPQQAAPLLARNGHATKVAAVYVRDSVVPRQAFVDERIIGVQKIERAAILAHDAVEEHLGLLSESLSQIVVEVGEGLGVPRQARQIAQVQPLRCEVGC